jgi:alpha-methylacyl-CoA racemase
VLDYEEAPHHPHLAARRTFVEVGGVVQPAPAPRFSSTPTGEPSPPAAVGSGTDAILAEIGLDPAEVESLRSRGVVA